MEESPTARANARVLATLRWASIAPAGVALAGFFAPWHRVYEQTPDYANVGDGGGSCMHFAIPSTMRDTGNVSFCSGFDHQPYALPLGFCLVGMAVLSATKRRLAFAGGEVGLGAGVLWMALGASAAHSCAHVDVLPAQRLTIAALLLAVAIPAGRLLFRFVKNVAFWVRARRA